MQFIFCTFLKKGKQLCTNIYTFIPERTNGVGPACHFFAGAYYFSKDEMFVTLESHDAHSICVL